MRAIDGLRGVAIAGVLAYHAAPSLVPGGFLGVEVFFVLSGYLVTALLLDEHRRTGALDWWRYVQRRVSRIGRALGVLLMGLVVIGSIVASSDAYRLRADLLWSALGLTNWHLIDDGNSYFAQLGRLPRVRHLWSLAIEIQFYALVPAVVTWLVRRRGGRDVTGPAVPHHGRCVVRPLPADVPGLPPGHRAGDPRCLPARRAGPRPGVGEAAPARAALLQHLPVPLAPPRPPPPRRRRRLAPGAGRGLGGARGAIRGEPVVPLSRTALPARPFPGPARGCGRASSTPPPCRS